MTLLALLSSLAFAGGPVAILIPTDAPPDAKELKQHLEESLERPGLKLEDKADLLAHPKALATSLLAHPSECVAVINESQADEIATLRKTYEDELFVVLPTGDKPREALVWRWEVKSKQLQLVAGKKKQPVAPAAAPGKLLMLPWKDARQTAETIAAAQQWLKASAVEVATTTDGTLIDALMEHPDECSPELSEAILSRIPDLATGVEGDLVIAVQPPTETGTRLWRWDPDAKKLLKITSAQTP